MSKCIPIMHGLHFSVPVVDAPSAGWRRGGKSSSTCTYCCTPWWLVPDAYCYRVIWCAYIEVTPKVEISCLFILLVKLDETILAVDVLEVVVHSTAELTRTSRIW